MGVGRKSVEKASAGEVRQDEGLNQGRVGMGSVVDAGGVAVGRVEREDSVSLEAERLRMLMESETGQKISDFLDKWRVVFHPFRSKYMFWPSIMMCRRVLNVMCAVFLSLSPELKLWALFLIQFLALLLQILIKPFRRRVLNWMDTCSLVVLSVFSTLLMNQNAFMSTLAAVVFLLGLVVMVFLFVISSPRLIALVGFIKSKMPKKD
eukprot:TRINITY_DN20047_c0_g1_i1.p1 TRINITY_DN20047_c0_g1~~TRINITY_DN20047_c0_g1_i1.p1  ORF type:complete len:207 (+),score=9.92 TRINITY_DN20047_c0_g1_i1:99-719(+)